MVNVNKKTENELKNCRCTTDCCESVVSGENTQKVQNNTSWINGIIASPIGDVFQISNEWSISDYVGQFKSRISSFRMKYSVAPGIYAIGNPNKKSDILVSANYKLSFDTLRRALKDLDVWILVLDTDSINVWCAAGKGTFGTEELINRILENRIDQIVEHNRIIVPQLGAPGIKAHEIKKRTGFKVHFGPVDAKDIPAYLKANYTATKKMRRKRFTILDRLVLTPMEINPFLKKFFLYALIVLLFFGLQPSGILFNNAWHDGKPFLILGLLSILCGAFITPIFLPFIPFRAFSIKGWLVGVLMLIILSYSAELLGIQNIFLIIFTYLFYPLLISYIALQFTGSTTFTGISGVNKELKIGIPIYVIGTAISIILLIIFK